MQAMKAFFHEQRILLARILQIICVLVVLFSAYRLLFYSMPMMQGNYYSAANPGSGDNAVALYDAGLVLYKKGDHKNTLKLLAEAYSACATSQGEIPVERKQLAAQIKFLAGNALVNSNQLKNAVEAYKEALRLDPGHMYAKYNLEFLQQMNGGKGPMEPSGGAGKGIKQGI